MSHWLLQSQEDIDQSILKDLEGLGWGTQAELEEKLLNHREPSINNLETVFYSMLAARNMKRLEEVIDWIGLDWIGLIFMCACFTWII